MASWTTTIGAPTAEDSSQPDIVIVWGDLLGLLIDSGLYADGVTSAFLNRFVITKANSGRSRCQISVSPDDTTAESFTGPDLSDAWENGDASVVLSAGSLSLTLTGSNNAAVDFLTDTSEPYSYWYENGNSYATAINDFIVGYAALTAAQKAATTLTLDDGAGQPPVANAGIDQTVIGGATVTLNSGGSTDIDGSIISQGWTQTAGTTVTLSDPSAVAPTFTAPTTATEREYTFQVEVTDDDGLTATDTVTITVEANQAPVVSIQTGDMTVNAGAVVSLAATITDREGGMITPSWAANPNNGTFTDSGAASTMWTAPDDLTANTSHALTLTGEDALGLTHSDSITITVRRANMAPTVDAGNHQDVEPGATVTLTAIASDQDGTIASYLWVQISGTVITLMAANTSEATFTAPADFDTHSLSFRCSVTDNDGAISHDMTTVDVAAQNRPPSANAGSNQSVAAGASVTLDASGSTDPDGTIQAYLWEQVSGETVTLANATTVRASFTAPSDMDTHRLRFQVTTTDDDGATDTDRVRIDVSAEIPPDNLPPTANAGVNRSVAAGTAVSLDGSASSDSDGTIASYAWVQESGTTVTLADEDTATPDFTAPSDTMTHTLVFELTVTDDDGATNTSTVTIEVAAMDQPLPNTPPTANAGVNRSVAAGATVTLDASGSADSDGTIASYAWVQVSGTSVALSSTTIAMPTFTAPSDADIHVLVFEITVTDDDGATDTDTVTIQVAEQIVPTNVPPTANAGPNRVAAAGESVTLDASGSTDIDGSIAGYAWQQLLSFGQTSVTLANANQVRPSLTAPSEDTIQTLVFEVTVTDNEGSTDTDTVTLQVAAQPTRSTVIPEIASAEVKFLPTLDEDEDTPTGRYMAFIRNHLVISGNDDDPYMVYWSSVTDSQDFKPARSTQAGFKPMESQYGRVLGLVPGKFGYVFQENAVSTMVGVDPRRIFRFDVIDRSRGAFAPESICWTGGRVFFYSEEGFYMLTPGSEALPIGAYKVNRWVYRNVVNIEDMVGYANPTGNQVYWSVRLGSCDHYDAILVYDWIFEEWGLIYQDHTRLGVHHPGPDILLPETDAGADDLWNENEVDGLEGSFGDETYRGDIPKLYVFTDERRRGVFGTGHKLFRVKTGFFPVRPGAPNCTVSGVRPIVDALEDCELGGERVRGKVADNLSSKSRREADFEAVVHPSDGKARMKEVGKYIQVDYRSERLVDEISGFEIYSRQKTRFSP